MIYIYIYIKYTISNKKNTVFVPFIKKTTPFVFVICCQLPALHQATDVLHRGDLIDAGIGDTLVVCNTYGWWFRNPANQLRLVVYPILYSVSYIYIPGGCLGFLNHQQ